MTTYAIGSDISTIVCKQQVAAGGKVKVLVIPRGQGTGEDEGGGGVLVLTADQVCVVLSVHLG